MPAQSGMKLMASLLPDGEPLRAPMQTMVTANDLLNASITKRWTREHDEALADLRRVADGDGMDPTDAVVARAVVVLVRAMRVQMAEESPDPQDRPTPAELTEVEGVLDLNHTDTAR